MSSAAATELQRSPGFTRFMTWWFEGFFRRHMNGLRVARWGMPAAEGGGPLVVYSNHPSWWDAVLYILLMGKLFQPLACYAPMDAAMLRKYRFFARLGVFPLDLDSRQGAAAFLRTATAVLGSPDRALWVTAQGRFVDARARPVHLLPGIAHLPEVAPGARFVPLAIDYTFWTERGAEALVAFGPALAGEELAALPRAARLARLEDALTASADRLAADGMAREPGRFLPLIEGRRGVGGVYDVWRRLDSWARGRSFDPAHEETRS